jgi:hypothetical protein
MMGERMIADQLLAIVRTEIMESQTKRKSAWPKGTH